MDVEGKTQSPENTNVAIKRIVQIPHHGQEGSQVSGSVRLTPTAAPMFCHVFFDIQYFSNALNIFGFFFAPEKGH